MINFILKTSSSFCWNQSLRQAYPLFISTRSVNVENEKKNVKLNRDTISVYKNIDLYPSLRTPLPSTFYDKAATSDFENDLQKKNNVKTDPSTLNKYLSLGKSRLSGLVVLTSMAGYGFAPYIAFNPQVFAICAIGTGFCALSANSINQIMEVAYDSQMTRTQARPLVRNILTQNQAKSFAALAGVSGTLLLSTINATAGLLGLFNIFFYTCVYTPSKRSTVACTWIGAVVGGIPPLIGWSAAVGYLDLNSLLLAAVLFSWQFPHFNALSWNSKNDYLKAGYRMLVNENPDLCRKVALRHSVALNLMCYAAPLLGLTSWGFICASTPLNLTLLYTAYQFKHHADSKSARRLFRYTLIHLPTLLILFLVFKKKQSGNGQGDKSISSCEKLTNEVSKNLIELGQFLHLQ